MWLLFLLLLVVPAQADFLPHASFRADNCGNWLYLKEHVCVDKPQTGFIAGQYNLVRWSTLHRAERSDRFSENGWQPVLPGEERRTVQFSGQLLILNARASAGIPQNYVARIWKNGRSRLSMGAKIGTPAPQFGPHVFIIPLDMQDMAEPGDTYQVQLYVSHPDAVIDNHPLHTWWSGQ